MHGAMANRDNQLQSSQLTLTGDAETKMATREHVAEAICMAVAAQALEAEQ